MSGRMRGAKKIYLGDGGDPEMLAAIRAHGNFIEFVPLCLLLIYFASDYYGYRHRRRHVARSCWSRACCMPAACSASSRWAAPLGAAGTTILLAVASVMLRLAGFILRQF